VPRIRRSRTLPSPPEALWEILADPYHLPRWWPNVERVEVATEVGWTEVMRTEKGRTVRASFTRIAADAPRRLAWRQELAGSAFARVLSESTTEVRLQPTAQGGTHVTLALVQRLRGMARFGILMVRRAGVRRLDEALDGLERIAVGGASPA
jgi:uncharacterized protein YndB with AHSA1/START domain